MARVSYRVRVRVRIVWYMDAQTAASARFDGPGAGLENGFEKNLGFLGFLNKSRAIAGRTARCRCKFR